MPPKKRSLEETSPNVATRSAKTRKTSNTRSSKDRAPPSEENVENVDPAPAEKETQADESVQEDDTQALESLDELDDEESGSSDDGGTKTPMDEKDPYEYILMRRPPHDIEAENEQKSYDDQLDEEEIQAEWKRQSKPIKHDCPASTKPDWKWILMRGTWIKYATSMKEKSYCCPDAFDMYIYNDFEGYGQLELLENHIQAFATEYAKKNPSLKDMWIQLAALVHLIKDSQMAPVNMIDDGERLSEFVALLGCAYLTMLNALDRAGQLKPDSDFQDLGLISAMYMDLPSEFGDSYDTELLDWGQHVKAYIEVYKIDTKFVFGSEEVEFGDTPLSDYEDVPKAGPDRWKFKKMLKDYKRYAVRGRLGGKEYDITKMSRSQRASYAFDKKDPLADVPDEALKKGWLSFQ